MFKYAEHNLLNNEQIIYAAKFHWFVYAPAVMVLLMIPLFPVRPLFTGSLVGLAVLLAIKCFIMQLSTEFVVTSMRVIVKTGLISRNTVELNHRNVESINLDQGILGRIFGFGSLTLNGTGAGTSPVPWIDNPLEFRKKVLEVVHSGR